MKVVNVAGFHFTFDLKGQHFEIPNDGQLHELPDWVHGAEFGGALRVVVPPAPEDQIPVPTVVPAEMPDEPNIEEIEIAPKLTKNGKKRGRPRKKPRDPNKPLKGVKIKQKIRDKILRGDDGDS